MNDTNTRLVINPVTRTIAPKYRNQKAVYVAKNDHNSVLICFELPRYVDGYDMSAEENVIHIHYANVSEEDMSKYSNGVSDAVNVEVETDEATKEEIVSFCWRIPNTATRYAGVVSVGITFERYDNIDGKTEEVYSWSTAPYGKTIVWDSMDNSTEVVEREYNYLVETCNAIVATALRTDLHYLVDEALQEAKESGEFKGDKGDTGDKGDKGDDGFSPSIKVTNITGGHKVEITDETGTSSFEVIDGNGGENTVTKKNFVLSANEWVTVDEYGEFAEYFKMHNEVKSLDLTYIDESESNGDGYYYSHPEKAIFVHLLPTATLEQRIAYENANIHTLIRGYSYRVDEDENSPMAYDYYFICGMSGDTAPTVDIPIEVVIVGKTSTTIPFIAENGNWWVGTTDTGVRAEGYTPQKYIDYWTEEEKREISTLHSGAYRVSKTGAKTLTLNDVDKPEHNMTVSAIKPVSIDFLDIKRALEEAGYTYEEIENGFIINGTNTNTEYVYGMVNVSSQEQTISRVTLYCTDSNFEQNLVLMYGDGIWFELPSEPKYISGFEGILGLNIEPDTKITLNNAKLIFSVEELTPNIPFKVYGNSSEYTEYTTDENGQAEVNSIHPYMRITTTTNGVNLAVEYNKDLNKTFEEQKDEQDKKNRDISVQLTEHDEELQKHNTKLSEHSSDIDSIKEDALLLEKKVDENYTDLESKVAERELTSNKVNKVTNKQDDVSFPTVKAMTEYVDNKVEDVEAKAEKYTEDIQSINIRLSNHDIELAKHSSDIDVINERLFAHDTSLLEHNLEISEINTKLTEQEETNSKTSAKLNEHSSEISDIKSELSEQNQTNLDVSLELSEHEESLSKHTEDIQGINTKLNEQDAKLKETKLLFSNVLKGSASGEIITMNDVSSYEHEMKVKASSKNLIYIPHIVVGADATQIISCNITKTITISVTNDGAVIQKPTGEAADIWRFSFHYKSGKITYIADSAIQGRTSKTITADKTDAITEIHCRNTYLVSGQYKDIQIEEGTVATGYTPYVSDVSEAKVLKQGKNLLDMNKPFDFVPDKNNNYIYNAWLINPTGATITLSIIDKDPTIDIGGLYLGLTEIGYNAPVFKWNISEGKILSTISTANKENIYLSLYKINGNLEKIKQRFDIQIEYGDTATDYEPYVSAEYPISSDGTVEGVTSLHPTTTLYSDTAGVVVEAEYNRDINKAFEEVVNAIISLGGNV